MRILFVSSFHPFAKGEIGAGEAICGNNLKRFIEGGYAVDVFVISPNRQRANISIVEKCNDYFTYSTSVFNVASSILSNAYNGALIAPWFFTRAQPRVVDHINSMIDNNKYDFIWLDFPSSLGFAALIDHNDIRYCAHDIVTQRMERSLIKRWLSNSIRKVEASLLNRLSKVSTLSDKDRVLIENMGFSGPVVVVELGAQPVGYVDDAVNINNVIQEFSGKTNIVFFGNMQRAENHWSLMWFILFVFSRLCLRNKSVNLWVLGICPRMTLRFISKFNKRVHVIGAVDDPSLAFERADLCVAPLLFGAGVKIKVIQMLDSKACVMATPIGAEGVSQSDRLTIVEPKNFYHQLLNRLS
ncbi:glycosyltransferase family 4 protein [Aeromonas jandaei]|uniref:glycosyltransferase family 4 protein n=1 Tax=Aeromonas jandaei TaxID=650 RepID=UPI00366A9A55